MSKPVHLPSVSSRGLRWAALMILLAFALPILTAPPARAQTYTVLYNFTSGADSNDPYSGVILDEGNLYGTTAGESGGYGGGTVFKLTNRNGHWIFYRLYDVGGYGGLTIGPDGAFYGTNNNSAVFRLQSPPNPSPSPFSPWIETTLYTLPIESYSGVVFDRAGNIYGVNYNGGTYGYGTVFELSPSNGGWTETVLHNFGNGSDGQYPKAAVTLDANGNIYGTTLEGGTYGDGTVFELSYSPASGWTERLLYSFTDGNDGAWPFGGLIFDASGNLYGATAGLFSNPTPGGSVFKLTPSGNNWTFSVLYTFPLGGDACGPQGTPAMDAAGNLYDTTMCYGASFVGSVFKLTPTNGGWTYSTLHNFNNHGDGTYPAAGVTLDANGNIYGTTTGGGAYAGGIVFEITP